MISKVQGIIFEYRKIPDKKLSIFFRSGPRSITVSNGPIFFTAIQLYAVTPGRESVRGFLIYTSFITLTDKDVFALLVDEPLDISVISNVAFLVTSIFLVRLESY